MKEKPVSAVSKRGPKQSERRQAAEAAGMSRGQMWRAMKLASIPEDEFEALVESDEPPTVSELVEVGRQGDGLPPNVQQGRRIKRCPHCHKDI
jgi:hypothetical protein